MTVDSSSPRNNLTPPVASIIFSRRGCVGSLLVTGKSYDPKRQVPIFNPCVTDLLNLRSHPDVQKFKPTALRMAKA